PYLHQRLFPLDIVTTPFRLPVSLLAPVPPRPLHSMPTRRASDLAGVPVIVAVRGDGPAACAVNVNDAGFPACVIVRLSAASASISVDHTVEIDAPQQPEARPAVVIAGV